MFFPPRVIENGEKNRMTYQSIAIVFGPTLLKPERETGNIAVHTVYQNQIVELILLELSTVFGRWLSRKTACGIDAGFQDFKSYTWCVSFWTKQWLWFCTFLRVKATAGPSFAACCEQTASYDCVNLDSFYPGCLHFILWLSVNIKTQNSNQSYTLDNLVRTTLWVPCGIVLADCKLDNVDSFSWSVSSLLGTMILTVSYF